MIIPGTNHCHEPDPPSSGPKSTRNSSGCISPKTMTTGLRSVGRNVRRNTSQVSCIACLPQGTAGHGQEDVVECRPVHLDRDKSRAGLIEFAPKYRQDGGAPWDPETERLAL